MLYAAMGQFRVVQRITAAASAKEIGQRDFDNDGLFVVSATEANLSIRTYVGWILIQK